jgi:hypothetical protein
MPASATMYFRSVPAALKNLGFTATGAGTHQRDDFVLRLSGSFPTLEAPLIAPSAIDALRGWIGRPGLWKCVAAGPGWMRRFDLPQQVLRQSMDDDEAMDQPSALQQILTWAMSTASGEPFPDWQAPADDELPLSELDLVIRSGRFIRHGRIVRNPGRLALRIPVLPSFRDALPPPRMEWLCHILLEAQGRCPMVRLGLAPESTSIEAEIDLSGAGASLLEMIIPPGLAALRWVVAWLVEPVSLLADATVVSQALQAGPVRAERPL